MPETVSACPLCGHNQSAFFDRRTFQGQPVLNRICQACGLVFQSPRMSDVEREAFYSAEYRQLYQGWEGPDAKDLAVQSKRAESLLAFCQAYGLPGAGRYLDIGCSAGLLLEAFRQAYGCQVVGVEPGEAYREFAQQSGLEVVASLEALEQAGPAHFDLISLAHVLEHLPDPVHYLANLRESLLEGDGWLLIEVPNLYAHDSFEIAHLVSFSAHTLRQTLDLAGFEIVALEAHGRPRSRILPLYLTALARPAEATATVQVQPESRVRLKRWWGMTRRGLLSRMFPRWAWRTFP
jgi:2-polyprenyl-3-methyl-5-hydroxy-6-metoxy-1,4-benzoquinol methylase